MKIIPLFSLEDSDLATLSWNANRWGYAQRTVRINGRLVAARKFGRVLLSSEFVDHENRNVADCQRHNLRLTNHAGNSQNKTCGQFRGTTLHKSGKWQAMAGHIYLGLFADRKEAAGVAALKRIELGYLD